MSQKLPSSLLEVPAELVYRILDNMGTLDILFSARNVCTRLNLIIDSYHRYQVNFVLECDHISHLFELVFLKFLKFGYLLYQQRELSNGSLPFIIQVHSAIRANVYV